MKKIFVMLALASPSLVFAAGNTITFRGQVASQTCQVSVDGEVNPVVLLPTVTKASLSTAGAITGETPFTVRVDGCAASAASDVAIKTMFLVNAATSGGNIPNVGTAQNVALQLLEGTGGNPVKMVAGAPTSVKGLVLKKGTDVAAEYTFAVRYISEGGAAGVGTVIGSVQYALDYL
ncbi:P pilus assembly protein, pilin FimA [Herbaspirillum sp. CF444]|uniref:fimbrial protein n=1 Tax=Herbaspirillum sp. CF444 TaxID=1144319 RepID=UPI0002722D96|nr:fimbrial protein [Herbaspirillum sp. CF444]EJL88727.1 P pilus assembly protein, pilin FimA [Herbaspirillum sp. CF444]